MPTMAIPDDSTNENLIKVTMRRMDFEHIKKILEYRAHYLMDAESFEVIEQLKKYNKHYG